MMRSQAERSTVRRLASPLLLLVVALWFVVPACTADNGGADERAGAKTEKLVATPADKAKASESVDSENACVEALPTSWFVKPVDWRPTPRPTASQNFATEVEPNGSVALATPIVSGSVVRAAIYPNADADFYPGKFTARDERRQSVTRAT